jgi:hypothetical protein
MENVTLDSPIAVLLFCLGLGLYCLAVSKQNIHIKALSGIANVSPQKTLNVTRHGGLRSLLILVVDFEAHCPSSGREWRYTDPVSGFRVAKRARNTEILLGPVCIKTMAAKDGPVVSDMVWVQTRNVSAQGLLLYYWCRTWNPVFLTIWIYKSPHRAGSHAILFP